MSFRRMLPFILINVVVSAVVVLAILYWWEGRDEAGAAADLGGQTAVSATTPFIPETDSGAARPAETATPQADDPDEPPVHIVQAGETLGSISQFYGVSLDDIMAANNLTNPNLISVGQQLLIPVNGLQTAVEPTTEPAANPETTDVQPTPIATEPVPTGDVVIEISQVIGAGQLENEAVQIRNVGSSAVALLDWKLVDQQNQFYRFGQVTLFGDGAGILVHSRAGANSATELHWGQSEPVWQPGELVTLLDANDQIVATYTIP